MTAPITPPSVTKANGTKTHQRSRVCKLILEFYLRAGGGVKAIINGALTLWVTSPLAALGDTIRA